MNAGKKTNDSAAGKTDNIIMNDNFTSPPTLVGAQIRKLRRSLGWTLAELARKAGTSTPALHRYESGWDRFQVETLRKIASALGASLEIRLVKESTRQRKEPRSAKLLLLLENLFWDKKLEPADLDSFPHWIMCRVLMFGNLKQVGLARGHFGDRLLKEAVASRAIDRKTRNFWTLMLEE